MKQRTAQGWLPKVWAGLLSFAEIIGLREERSNRNEQLYSLFKLRYQEFRDLLTANNDMLEIIADLEVLLRGDKHFGLPLLKSKAIQAYAKTYRLVESLQRISENGYPELKPALESIEGHLINLFADKELDPPVDWVLPLARVDRKLADHVGNKMANLGDIRNRLGLPTPEGFAITTAATRHFIEVGGIAELIDDRLSIAEPEDLDEASRLIRETILETAVPEDLAQALLEAYDALTTPDGAAPKVALRSSAAHEDSEASFAGQYTTVLNVTRDGLLNAYRQVVASFFTPRATFYRRHLGVADEEIDMGVGCVVMVNALASGVAFSRDPVHPDQDHLVLIHAVWGLGPTLADGLADPDIYLVERAGRMPHVDIQAVRKTTELVSDPLGGVKEVPVPEACQDTPCLEPDEIRGLSRWVLMLEKHFGDPQDVEWVLDQGRHLFIVQSRPLHQVTPLEPPELSPTIDRELLIQEGLIASPGIATGTAVLVRSAEDLTGFPKGGVLVAANSSPEYVQVMDRAAAIVTDVGSTIGHMASVAREFRVPTLVATRLATRKIAPGQEVTVDAIWGRVYRGHVWELLTSAPVVNPFMKGHPIFELLERLAACVIPLNLTNPRAPDFTPGNCQTLHDIARFVHEKSFYEMFGIGMLIDDFRSEAVLLDVFLPIDLYIIDLGGALDIGPGERKIKPAKITSYPLSQVVSGMLHKEIPRSGPRAMDTKGFAELIMQQALSNPQQERTFQDPCYAIASDRYLNFTARVGYHFSALDSYCGNSETKNYISFRFAGGAADAVRRGRRARAIAEILEAGGFQIDLKADRVDAKIQKRSREEIGAALEMIGRMFQFVRQMDVAMSSDRTVAVIRDAFLTGNYRLDPNFKSKSESPQEG